MQWTWDPEKDRENIIKHGISFSDAQEVFLDLLPETHEDPYPYEQRWRTIGVIGSSIVMVIHTLPGEGPGRIISARRVTRAERRDYEEGNGQAD